MRARRELRGWSIRFAASRAGVAHTTWLRIERGDLRTDRYMIADIAAALDCPVADLTGRPYTPADRQLELAHSRLEPVRRTLVEIAPNEPTDRQRQSVSVLSERLHWTNKRRMIADFAAVAHDLPDLLADLHAASSGPEGAQALRMLVNALHTTTLTFSHLGYSAEPTLAAERCRQIAEHLDEPVPLAVADWDRAFAAQTAGSYRRAATLTHRSIDGLQGHLADATAREVLGMLHLTAAVAARSPDDEHVAEAARLAELTGQTDSWTFMFGPSEVAIFRMQLATDCGEPGRALAISDDVDAAVLTESRRASFYVERARALADERHDHDAERMLLAADRLAPQGARSWTAARETARFLINQAAREAVTPALRGLCERMGVAAQSGA
jgi:transcriptional regulator with XRE-family HTH domain